MNAVPEKYMNFIDAQYENLIRKSYKTQIM
jgi:hypothetical protein